MSKLMQRWKKTLTGGCSKKDSLIENDFLQPISSDDIEQQSDEFIFVDLNKNISSNNNNYDNTLVHSSQTTTMKINKIFPIYNEYDNLKHHNHSHHQITSSNGVVPTAPTMTSSTNTLESSKENQNVVNKNSKSFFRVFCSKSSDKNVTKQKNQAFGDNNDDAKLISKIDCAKKSKINQTKKTNNKNFNFDENKNLFNTDNFCYNEITESANLIENNNQQITRLYSSSTNNLRMSGSKINLFPRLDNDDQQQQEDGYRCFTEQQQINTSNLTEQRELNTFANQPEAFHWYLNEINQAISNCIKLDKALCDMDRSKRLSICTAHFLFSKNFYEMRINNSINLKAQLANVHPCLISLACLLESDAVRIIDQHACACDTYIYLFSTRLKFCAWKTKLYIILKKPKRSSIDRLNLIEDLTNCHKLIQDKSLD